MPEWRITARTDLDQLRRRPRELLKAFRAGDAGAARLFGAYHPDPPGPGAAKLADAQLTLARAHDYPSWPRLTRGAEMFNAIAADDAGRVLSLIRAHPAALGERVNGETSNWGPPLVCAAQVGAEAVLDALLPIEGQDLDWALDRAALKGRTDIARRLLARGAAPEPGAALGPCETLNVEGLRFLKEIGAPLTGEDGDPLAPVAMILEGYHRDRAGKHACLAFLGETGIAYPDTPVMALHLGRIDLLEAHVAGDPDLLARRFAHAEIWPPELGCHAYESLALHGTPLAGTTLLHMAIDFDEIEIARWLIERGADPDAPAETDAEGFGDHAPLFNAVVSQANRTARRDDAFGRLLLDAGADPRPRASIRKGIRFHDDESVHAYRDVTPLAYGRAFHARAWVSGPVTALLSGRGG